MVSVKGGFHNVVNIHQYLIVTLEEIKLGEPSRVTELVNTEPPRAVVFFNEQDQGRERSGTGPNNTLLQHCLNLTSISCFCKYRYL